MSSIVPFMCAMMILNNGVNKSHHSSYEDYSHVSHNLFSEETNRYTNITSSYPNQGSDTISAFEARLNNITPVNGFYGYPYHDLSKSLLELGYNSNITCAEMGQFRSSQYQGLNDPYSIEQIERIRASCQTANIETLRGQIDNLQCNILRQNLYSNAIQDLQKCVEKVMNEPNNDPVVTTRSSSDRTDENVEDLYAVAVQAMKDAELRNAKCMTDPIAPYPKNEVKVKKSFVQKIGDALYKVTDILNMLIELFISDDF